MEMKVTTQAEDESGKHQESRAQKGILCYSQSLPSGKRLHNYEKLTINMAIFNSYVSHYQRVNHHFPIVFL
jgi:hypothetical protein